MAKEYKLKIKTDDKSLTESYGKFIIQPLERGYGVTVGNALRRVLLTSIPGAAITNVKIEGVLHEFSTISGVKDDMADIIQNLKGIRFKLSESNVDNVKIALKGKQDFTGANIQAATDQFEVLNQDHYITELNTKGTLELEIRIGVGKGYVPSEENELPNAPIGTLAIDSIFNPVTKVTFNVQPVPGAKDPIEILALDVTTDGSITAKDAVSLFPKNVNVAALLSLVGLGSKKTSVRIVADPNTNKNTHQINANGKFGKLSFIIENIPDSTNPKTSRLATLSAIELVRQICTKEVQIGT